MGRRTIKERAIPTRKQLVKALVDPWTLFDIINFHGGRKGFGQCHEDLLKFQRDIDTDCSLAMMPRGHLKTTLRSVGDTLHALYVNPNIRIYIGSAHKDLARAILREIGTNLTDEWNQKYVWNNRPHFEGRLVPVMDKGLQSRRNVLRAMSEEELEKEKEYKKIIWNADAIQVISPYKLKEPSVAVGSVESVSTGYHYDRLVMDDVINYTNYDTDEKRNRLDRWKDDMMSVLDPPYFDEELYDRLRSVSRSPNYMKTFHKMSYVGGQIIASGTRYFKDDWYEQIEDEVLDDLKNGVKPMWSIYKKNVYANTKDNAEGYLWSEKWTPDIERSVRKRLRSERQWYSQYLNKVIVDSEQSLPYDAIKKVSPANIMYDKSKPGVAHVRVADEESEGNSFSRVIKLFMVVDPAATYSKRSDFTAIGVGGYDDRGNLFCLDGRLLKVHTDAWVNEVFNLAEKWGIRVFWLETVAFAVTLKIVFQRMFKDRFPITIKDYRPTAQTSKKDRIESQLEPLLKNDMLYLVSTLCRADVQDQFNFFPSETVKDDFLDMLAMLAEIAKETNQKVYKRPPRLRGRKQAFNRIYGGVY